MNEAVEDHESLLVGNHVGEDTEERVREDGLDDDIPRHQVDVEDALGAEQPVFDIFYECVQFLHAVCIQEAPFSLSACFTALGQHLLGQASSDELCIFFALHDTLQD